MPGGGVGIFNGKPLFVSNPSHPGQTILTQQQACTSQYGAPQNGWGERYGGIKSKSECDGFPAALKAGCNWRFDWYVGRMNI